MLVQETSLDLSIDDLEAIRSVNSVSILERSGASLTDTSTNGSLNILMNDFHSKKITKKIQQQMLEPLVLTTGAFPDWCFNLPRKCVMLFPFESRLQFFKATSFGPARAITWYQMNRKLPSNTAKKTRGDEYSILSDLGLHDYLSWRLQKEFVRLPRKSFCFVAGGREEDEEDCKNEEKEDKDEEKHDQAISFWQWAVDVMEQHAERKTELEIQFLGEEGTGLGPTLEFFQLMAAEFCGAARCMWLQHSDSNFVHASNGLFPAPVLPRLADALGINSSFYYLGITIAKCLQVGEHDE